MMLFVYIFIFFYLFLLIRKINIASTVLNKCQMLLFLFAILSLSLSLCFSRLLFSALVLCDLEKKCSCSNIRIQESNRESKRKRVRERNQLDFKLVKEIIIEIDQYKKMELCLSNLILFVCYLYLLFF